jgi:lysozyme
MEIKELDNLGLITLEKLEGIRLKPYFDSVGVATIGIGCTYYEDGTRVKITDKPITKERAYKLFKTILIPYEKQVWSTTRDDITQNQFNALVCLCFNIGQTNFRQSTVLKRVNKNMSLEEIRAAWLMWKFAGGKPILLGRRKEEIELFKRV